MNETASVDDAVGTSDADGASTVALLASGVRKTYGKTVALDGVDISVASGEVFGLIGPNGAGKTTLVRALTGTADVEGTVRVFDEPPGDVDAERVGLLPQAFDPPERLTARELVAYYGGLYDDPRATEEVLADVGLESDADTWYETLSGGQKRRVSVATALVNDPDVLFLDEPTTGIDPAGRRDLHRLIEGLAAGGTTVFLTSHAMAEVERLADRIALLRDGRVVAEGDPERLVAEYGGEPTLDVRLVDGRPDETVRARIVEETPFDVETAGDGLCVRGILPQDIAVVVDALAAVDVAFESLSWSEPSLEDVYLELTGETYAPEADEEPAAESSSPTDGRGGRDGSTGAETGR